MGQALHISGGLVSQIGTNELEVVNIDTYAGQSNLTIGGGSATTIGLGTNAACMNVDLGTGSAVAALSIGTNIPAAGVINIGTAIGAGTAINIGTVGELVTIKGNLQVDGTQHVIGDTTFDEDITLGDAVGDAITLKGTFTCDVGRFNDIKFAANAGGVRQLYVADSAAGGTGVSILAGANSTLNGAGSSINLVPSAPNGAGTEYGKVYFGPTGNVDSDRAYMLLTNATASVDTAGLRYAGSAKRWELNNEAGGWLPIATGYAPSSLGTAYQHLEMNADKTAMRWVDSLTLPNNVPGLSIKPAANDAGSGQKLVVSAGEGNTQPGGDLSLRGGVGTLSTDGRVLIGDSTTSTVVLGVTNTWTFTTSTGMLAPAGTANINLPNNANARFQIEGSPVSDKVTAANLGTLTAGSGSNADALHTHVGLSASTVDVPVTTDGAAVNDVVYIGASDTITIAQANAAASAKAIGVKVAANSVRTAGVATVVVENGITVAAGDDLYLSATGAGDVTNVAPTTAGQYITYVGQAKTGAIGPATCTMYVRCERPLAL